MRIEIVASSVDSLYRSKHFLLGDRVLTTPSIGVKDIPLRFKDYEDIKNEVSESFIVENYIQLRRPELSAYQIKRNGFVRNVTEALGLPMVSIIEIPYNSLGNFTTNLSMLKSLIRIIRENIETDLITIPYVGGLGDKYWNIRDTYNALFKFFLAEFKKLPFEIGIVLQNIPRHDLKEIMNRVLDSEVNFFVLDFGAATLYSCRDFISNILSTLNDLGKLNQVILYGININKGRRSKDADEFRSRDIVAFGYGIDILGTKRLKARARDRPDTLKIYVLDIESYCYRYVGDVTSYGEKRLLEEIENAVLKLRETSRIKKILKEKGRILGYLKNKKCIDERDFKTISNWKELLKVEPEIDLTKFFKR